ncbi:MAG: hypothetical protein MJ252_04240 [archaeon]|nr:hypothetical protein [archaeon]
MDDVHINLHSPDRDTVLLNVFLLRWFSHSDVMKEPQTETKVLKKLKEKEILKDLAGLMRSNYQWNDLMKELLWCLRNYADLDKVPKTEKDILLELFSPFFDQSFNEIWAQLLDSMDEETLVFFAILVTNQKIAYHVTSNQVLFEKIYGDINKNHLSLIQVTNLLQIIIECSKFFSTVSFINTDNNKFYAISDFLMKTFFLIPDYQIGVLKAFKRITDFFIPQIAQAEKIFQKLWFKGIMQFSYCQDTQQCSDIVTLGLSVFVNFSNAQFLNGLERSQMREILQSLDKIIMQDHQYPYNRNFILTSLYNLAGRNLDWKREITNMKLFCEQGYRKLNEKDINTFLFVTYRLMQNAPKEVYLTLFADDIYKYIYILVKDHSNVLTERGKEAAYANMNAYLRAYNNFKIKRDGLYNEYEKLLRSLGQCKV